MNKKETKNQMPAKAIKNADEAQTFDKYMEKVVKKAEKQFPGHFLFLIAANHMEVGESSGVFATIPADKKLTAGILAALLERQLEPLLESIVVALHRFISDNLGEGLGDEFDIFMADLLKRATQELDQNEAEAEAETTTDEK